MKVSGLLLCLFLIAFGCAAGFFLVRVLFLFPSVFSFVALFFYFPTLAVVSALPLYAGFAYLFEMIKKKGKA